MKFSCEKCGRAYVADEKVRGRAFKMKCKTCGNMIVVKPGAAGAPAPLSPEPVASPPLAVAPVAATESLAPAAYDPFALSPADPFSLPAGDPFAKPPVDPFVTATREDTVDAPLPAAPPPELELEIPSDDPFARAVQAESAPAPDVVTAPLAAYAADAVTTPGLPQLSEADAMFADLAEEMRATEPPAAELPPAPAPPEPDAPAAPRTEAPPAPRAVSPAPAVRAPAPAAKSSRAGLVLAAAAALIVAVAGAAWVALKPSASAAPEHAAAAAPSPAAAPAPRPLPATAPAAAPRREPVESPAAADTLPPAALADLRADQAAKKRPDDRGAAEPPRAAAKPTAAAKPVATAKPVAAARPAPAAKPAVPEPTPPPPPEPSKPEVKVAQVQVQPRSRRVVEQAPPPDVHTAPSAPPLSSNADLPPLDDAMIEATVAKYARSFDGCAVAARQNEPQLALDGRKVVVTMTVNPNGKALYPTLDDVELSGSEFGKCVKRESARMIFPAFGGEPIRARVPLTLK